MFQNYLSYRALARADDKTVPRSFDDCGLDEMKVIAAEDALDLSKEPRA